MHLLPVQRRKIQWTRGLQQICRLLERHAAENTGIAPAARYMPVLVTGHGEIKVDMKHASRTAKISHCSLPRCQKNDHGELKDKFKRCKRCKVAKYCSKEHQVEHWKVHKRECKKHPLKAKKKKIQLPQSKTSVIDVLGVEKKKTY